MENETIIEIFDKVFELTISKKINWDESKSKGRFSTLLGVFLITLDSEWFQIFDNQNNILGAIQDNELIEERDCQTLVEIVRKNYLQLDEKLIELNKILDDKKNNPF